MTFWICDVAMKKQLLRSLRTQPTIFSDENEPTDCVLFSNVAFSTSTFFSIGRSWELTNNLFLRSFGHLVNERFNTTFCDLCSAIRWSVLIIWWCSLITHVWIWRLMIETFYYLTIFSWFLSVINVFINISSRDIYLKILTFIVIVIISGPSKCFWNIHFLKS